MAALAARQHGLVSRRQLLQAGLAASTIADWVVATRLHPIHRGVYAVGHRRLDRDGRWMAAVLACGSGAALSHGSAGQLGGFLDRHERLATHVSVPPPRSPHPRGIVVHRPRSLPARDVTTKLQIPVTTPTRTVWDMAATMSPKPVRRAFERLDGRRRLDRKRLATMLATSPTHRGASLISELLDSKPVPLEEVRSWLEELLMLICSEAGLLLPAVNVPLLDYTVDFVWPAARFVVEADGGDHLDSAQRDRDNERDFRLARAGFLVRRYSWKAMSRERQVVREVRGILDERLPSVSKAN